MRGSVGYMGFSKKYFFSTDTKDQPVTARQLYLLFFLVFLVASFAFTAVVLTAPNPPLPPKSFMLHK